jgi:hypothetical protein
LVDVRLGQARQARRGIDKQSGDKMADVGNGRFVSANAIDITDAVDTATRFLLSCRDQWQAHQYQEQSAGLLPGIRGFHCLSLRDLIFSTGVGIAFK